MAIPLIIVTPDAHFGDMLRRSLEDGNRFSFHIMQKVDEAGNRLQDSGCTLAFLDTSASDSDVILAGNQLRRINPKMRFIIASGTGWHAALEELHPFAYISKPVYLPDLVAIVDKLFPPEKGNATPQAAAEIQTEPIKSSPPPWLADVNRAAQLLTRLTLESSAQAALITRNDEFWAYAGQLLQPAARELADIVTRYRDRRGETDMLRFIRLSSTNADYMLYASRLAGNMMLALIFDAETPFGTIRSQASNLVRTLSNQTVVEQTTMDEALEAAEDADPEPAISFSDILTDIPAPNPPPDLGSPRTRKEAPAEQPSETSQETPIGSRIESGRLEYEEEESVNEKPEAREPKPSIVRKESQPEVDPSSGTRIRPESGAVRKIVLEPVSPSLYNLTYACLLVPRFPEHLLVGDLADRLAEWVPQICVAFGWRLEHISVHPDYLQWMVNIPPATSPGYLMRILRQHTSERIFAEFPRFSKENPSGDFWAPGYLIVGGTQSPPSRLIKEFIQQTRQRQGLA